MNKPFLEVERHGANKVLGQNMQVTGIPTMGEIEGQILLLELLVNCSAVRVFRLHDAHAVQKLKASVATEIGLACKERGLHYRDILDAQAYANQLLADAQSYADQLDGAKHAYFDRNRFEPDFGKR